MDFKVLLTFGGRYMYLEFLLKYVIKHNAKKVSTFVSIYPLVLGYLDMSGSRRQSSASRSVYSKVLCIKVGVF